MDSECEAICFVNILDPFAPVSIQYKYYNLFQIRLCAAQYGLKETALSSSLAPQVYVRQNKLISAVSRNEQQKSLVKRGPVLMTADLFFLLLPQKHSKGPI